MVSENSTLTVTNSFGGKSIITELSFLSKLTLYQVETYCTMLPIFKMVKTSYGV